MNRKLLLFILILTACLSKTYAQVADSTNFSIYYDAAKTYTLKGIDITGIKYLDKQTLRQLSGMEVGDEITVPGAEVTSAIKKYWRQGLFSDVKISATKVVGNDIWIEIYLQERPKLSEVNYIGISKSEREDVEEKVLLLKGGQITDNYVNTAQRTITNLFHAKGFYNTEVNIVQRDDPKQENFLILDVHVDKKEKVKVDEINFYGNSSLTDSQLGRAMKKTKSKHWKNFFKSKKFLEDEFKNDKKLLVSKYNEEGYRDAIVVTDTIADAEDENRVNVNVWVEEGQKYFFRDIRWVGNTVYTSEQLNLALGINDGDVFDQRMLDKRLQEDDDAVANNYLNTGYLFFNVNPVEVKVDGDSIDYEMRIYEGKQATIDRIIITGNTKTHEHVARRELRTKPGELFSKEDIIRSVRELANIGHFDPEAMNPVPIPHPENGTVDIKYELTERANDQIELSGGWGAGMFVGTVGLRFTNFSVRNIFNGEAWKPLPTGDGQTLSLRAQTNGSYYQSYNFSFVEPWFGGKKPNSFSVSGYYSKQTSGNSDYNYNGYDPYGYSYGSGSNNYYGNPYDYDITEQMSVFGASVGLGYRLKWPDDFFTLYHEVSYTQYNLDNWSYFLFRDGISRNLAFKTVIGRNSIDNPLYTRSGSNINLSVEFTPPYSLFNDVDYEDPDVSDEERYKFVEYHKWKFDGDFYTPLSPDGKLVLRTKFEYGFLGYFDEYRRSPFEQFNLGGDGMSGMNYYGSEVIGLRGYDNNSLTASGGGNIYNKYMAEIRYPLTLSQSATIYALAFAEAGNSWYGFDEYNPFDLKRSAGVGVRIFLPMFGLMGFDWGYGFDQPNNGNPDDSGSQFHFIIGQNF